MKKILIGLAFILAVLVVVITLRPADFCVSRTTTFAAPAPAVFEQFNDLQKMNAWSPWSKLDPNAQSTFAGPAAGVGASLAWAGNNQVGEGKMTIIESTPNDRILMRLEFVKPFTATNTTEFTFKPSGEKTTVSWTMSGKNNFIGRAVGLFMNCDTMVGEQFEQGFENVRAVVEKTPAS